MIWFYSYVDLADQPPELLIKMKSETMTFTNDVFEQVSDAVIVTDNDYLVTYMNPAAERQYGVEACEVVGSKVTDIFRYEWLDGNDEAKALTSLAEQGYWRGENIHITLEGRRLYVESAATRLLAQDGSPAGLMAVIRDVTEIRNAEEERRHSHELLRISEEKYRTLFESIGEGFCILEVIFDESGRTEDLIFRDVNPAFARQTGLQDPIGKSVRAILPELEEYWFVNYGTVAKTGKPMRFDNEAMPLGRYFEVYAFRVGAPNSRLVGVIFNDIIERKRAEAALRLSEEKYRTLFQSIDEGFCVAEVIFDEGGKAIDYRFLDTNPAFERQTGISDAAGKRMREIAPRHEEMWFETYGRVARTGESVRFEHQAEQLGRYYDVFAFRTGEPAENKVGILFNDIRERKRSEASERERERLQAIVRGQENERSRIARDLHDGLGQQFTALRLKLDALGRSDGAENRAAIEDITTMAESIDTGLDRLAWDLRPAALDDLGLASALAQFVREWSRHSGIAAEMLTSNVAEVRMPAEIETNLYRIAQEALHNVQKHAAAHRVDVMLQRSEDRLRLVIADDGRGFDSGIVEGNGGLGLISMRERAALIGGEFHIESSLGKGASVHITVPLPSDPLEPRSRDKGQDH